MNLTYYLTISKLLKLSEIKNPEQTLYPGLTNALKKSLPAQQVYLAYINSKVITIYGNDNG